MAWQSEKGLVGINYIIGFGYDFVRISISISLGCKFRIYKVVGMKLLGFYSAIYEHFMAVLLWFCRILLVGAAAPQEPPVSSWRRCSRWAPLGFIRVRLVPALLSRVRRFGFFLPVAVYTEKFGSRALSLLRARLASDCFPLVPALFSRTKRCSVLASYLATAAIRM